MYRGWPSAPGRETSETERLPTEFLHVADVPVSLVSVGSPNFDLSTPMIIDAPPGARPYERRVNRPSTKFAKIPWPSHPTAIQTFSERESTPARETRSWTRQSVK